MGDGGAGSRPPDDQPTGITRREALRKGAILGGALAWATPVVQVVGMKPAFAQSVSPGCRVEVEFLPGAVVACITYPESLCDCVAAAGNDQVAAAACFVGVVPISIIPGACP